MGKVIVGMLTGLTLGILWPVLLELGKHGTLPTFPMMREVLPVILTSAAVGAITGFLSLMSSRIVLGAIIINIAAFLILSWWRQESYMAGAVLGFINGFLIGAVITMICQRPRHT